MATILKVKNGGTWQNIPAIKGDKGDTGSQGAKGDTGAGVKSGGTTGQVLAKASNTDYDTEWVTPTSGGNVDDVKVNGTSVVTDKVANIDLTGKVDKVSGKQLSTEDYTTVEKTKLAGIETGAEVNVQSDWNETDSTADSYIQNKPTIPTVPTNLSEFTDDLGTTPVHTHSQYLTQHQSLSEYRKSADQDLIDATKVPTTRTVNSKPLSADIVLGYADVSALPNKTKYGATVELSMNSTTYVLSAKLKDQDGNMLGTEQTVDLPLESVVVSGRYDSATKKVILTLQSGSTIEFSVADLISGLVSDTTFNSHANDTTIHVTSSEKTTWNSKLDKAVPTTEQGSKEFLYSFEGTQQNTDVALINDMSSPTASYTDKMVATALSVKTELDKKVDAVSGKGLSTNDYDATEKSNVASNTSARHSHSNKALLDTYTQTEANLSDAVSSKHTHSNKSVLDDIDSTDISNWNGKADSSSLTSHTSNTTNPHSVTKAQVGLGNVPNTDFTSRVETLEGKTALSDFTDDLGTSPTHTHSQYALSSSLTSHTGNTSNPHSVTKSQVGLGNCDNTSDADKPVSTAVSTQFASDRARLDALESIEPHILEVNYPDSTYLKGNVPLKVCNIAGCKQIKGQSVAWNQLIPVSCFTRIGSGVTDNLNGTYTLTYDNTSGSTFYELGYLTFSAIANHKYLFIGWETTSAGVKLIIYSSICPYYEAIAPQIVSVTGSGTIDLFYRIYQTYSISNYTIHPMLVDLTLLYGSGNEPSAVSTVLSDYPELNSYCAYDSGSIKDCAVNKVTSRGKNLFTGNQTENLVFEYTGKTFFPKSTYFPHRKAGQQYTVSFTYSGSYSFDILFFNTGEVSLSVNGAGTYHVTFICASEEENALFFIRNLGTVPAGTTITLTNFQIEKGSSATSYSPYTTHELALPQTITLRSAGSVRDTYNPETGVITRNVGTITFDGSADEEWALHNSHVFWITVAGSKSYPTVDVATNSECNKFIVSLVSIPQSVISTDNTVHAIQSSVWDKAYSFTYNSISSVADWRTWLASNPVTLTYELATPTTETVTALNPIIQVESSGTVGLNHTESPAVASNFTMDYCQIS